MKQLLRINLTFIISLLMSAKLFAQADTTEHFVFGGFITLPIEFPIVDVNELNGTLSNLGFPNGKPPTASIGFGLQFHLKKVITTFSFNKTTRKPKTDSTLLEVEYRSTSLNVGYNLLRNYKFSLYPYIGLKGSGINYLFRQKLPDTTSFRNYFETNLDHKEVTNSRMHLDLGMGFSHQWFYLVNLRFGYLVPLEKVRWKFNNNKVELSNAPTIRYQYYFSLTLGLGNIVSSRDPERH